VDVSVGISSNAVVATIHLALRPKNLQNCTTDHFYLDIDIEKFKT
jgi:hypothetical protein